MINKILNGVKNKKIFYGILAIIIFAIFSISLFFLNGHQITPEPIRQITNFEECEKTGYPVLDSLPRQCATPDGRIFIEEIKKIISPKEYYGSSTYGQCQIDNNCYVSGCNSEICKSRVEEGIASICVVPDKPTPKQLNYGCRCANQKCQWLK